MFDAWRTGDVRRRHVAAVGVAAAAGAWIAAGALLQLAYSDRALPGTSVAGVDMGGAGLAQSRRSLEGVTAPQRSVQLVDRRRRFIITTTSAGLHVDVERTARWAVRAGRNGPLDFLAAPAAALGVRREVQPHYSVNAAALDRAIAVISRRVGRRAYAGGFELDPTTLSVRSLRPPRPGRVLDRAATRRAVIDALRAGRPARLVLPVRERPSPSRAAVEKIAEVARAYVEAGPLILTGMRSPYVVDTERLALLLAVERSGGEGQASIGLGVDRAALRRLVNEVAQQRNRPARDAQLTAPASPVVVDAKGDVSWEPRAANVRVRSGRAGRAVDPAGARRAIASAVRARDHSVRIPRRIVEPTVDTRAARRVRHLIGTFTTRFACCEPRAKNIQLIARAVDGTIIAPGRRFSLNDVAGERTRARGFVKAPFIADGEIVPSVGGGVSQFSTTMYNAAYFAGLQLDAHQPHSFFIDRYPPGREATLDWRSIDLVWTNDTDAPVLVRATSTATSVTVSLYGANGGRRVRAETGPRQAAPGHDFKIIVTRVVRYADGRQTRQAYTTTYDDPPEPD